MQVNDSRVCFVNSHMAAGNEELDKRNQDYRFTKFASLAFKSRIVILYMSVTEELMSAYFLHVPVFLSRKRFRILVSMNAIHGSSRTAPFLLWIGKLGSWIGLESHLLSVALTWGKFLYFKGDLRHFFHSESAYIELALSSLSKVLLINANNSISFSAVKFTYIGSLNNDDSF